MLLLIIISILILVVLLRPVYHRPMVVKNVLTHDECEYIMKEASKKLKPSTISHESIVDESVRKSETAWLDTNDAVINNIVERCVSFTDRPSRNCEKIQVIRYTPGGFYNPHQDCFEDDENQRMYTCIIALNDGYDGGATSFPNLNKSYKLRKGDMLFFNTLNDWGRMTPHALHGGETVTRGEKWICNLWIRRFPYNTDKAS